MVSSPEPIAPTSTSPVTFAQVHVARADRPQGDAATDAIEGQIAGADAAELGLAGDAGGFQLARADAQHLERTGAIEFQGARADLGGDQAGDVVQVDIARAHVGAGGPGAAEGRIARADVQLDQHVVGHCARQVQVGIAAAEADPDGPVLGQADNEFVARPLLGHDQALEQVLATGAGPASQGIVGARGGLELEVTGADLEQHGRGPGKVQLQRTRL